MWKCSIIQWYSYDNVQMIAFPSKKLKYPLVIHPTCHLWLNTCVTSEIRIYATSNRLTTLSYRKELTNSLEKTKFRLSRMKTENSLKEPKAGGTLSIRWLEKRTKVFPLVLSSLQSWSMHILRKWILMAVLGTISPPNSQWYSYSSSRWEYS